MGGHPVIMTGICAYLDVAYLMALVIVLEYIILLLSVVIVVKESVCIVILFYVPLASSSANRMTVISASSTDAESFSLIIISSFLCTTATATVSRHLNRQYSTCCRLDENGCILVISVSVLPFPP